MMDPTLGRIVQYHLSAEDAATVLRRRTTSDSISNRLKDDPPRWPAGAQAHIGNLVMDGQTLPMMIVRVWEDQTVNGQVFLDGCDVLWVTGVAHGVGPGMWRWPERV